MGDLLRPPPHRSFVDHAIAVVRWIGIGRLAAIGASVLAVAAGSFWLLRTPESAGSDRAVPGVSVTAPTVPAAEGGTISAETRPGSAVGGTTPGAAATTAPAPPTSAARIVVHVAGAVTAPGVYELAGGSRVGDAVAAAGGAGPDAVLDAVNLAALVNDGQQVYVPRAGEAAGPAPPAAAPPVNGTPDAVGPLDLNAATEDELLALPGVGPVLAAAIVRHREETGPFTSVDGLLDVSGIGPARLESLRDLVRV
jgi:competence protein ComEA